MRWNKIKTKKWTLLVLSLFILLNLTDILTTVMAKIKHGEINEANPLYILTGSFFIMFAFKVALTFIIVFFLWYTFKKHYPMARYALFILVAIFTYFLFFVSVNNYLIYKEPVDSLALNYIPEDERINMAEEVIVVPQLKLFLFCIATFFVFTRLDNENRKL